MTLAEKDSSGKNINLMDVQMRMILACNMNIINFKDKLKVDKFSKTQGIPKKI